MMHNPIDALLEKKGVLLADGATGTNLFAMGLESGEAPELWNESAPEKVTALHKGFVDAGSDIILGSTTPSASRSSTSSPTTTARGRTGSSW